MKFCPKCGRQYADNIDLCSADGVALVVGGRDTDPLPGGTFAGRYQIVEKIGQGGMGAVYKAIHTRMNRVCAIKILAIDQAEGQSPVERFNREAQLASRIDSPHAVVIYDFGETEDGVLFLVMEYVDGQSLGRVLLREKTFTPERACRVAGQIAEALGAAHALGIVHRDLKPDNVMLASRTPGADYVKVLDFGIAKTVTQHPSEDLTQTGFVLGTPAYMSPEQLAGEKLDPRSDIYSLALIVYQMLSGRLPFEGENTQARLIKRLIDSPIPLRTNAPSLSADLEAAVMAGLARSPDDRPASAPLFADSLEACIDFGIAADQSKVTAPVQGMPADRVTTVGPTAAQVGGTAPQSGPTAPDSMPTIPVGAQVTNANEPGTREYESPSSYVTRQSTTPMVSGSSGSPGHGPPQQPGSVPIRQEGQLPPEPAGPESLEQAGQIGDHGNQVPRLQQSGQRSPEQQGKVAPETVAVASRAGHVPSTRLNPRQGPALQSIGPTAVQTAQKVVGGKKSAVGIVIAVMGIGFLLIAIGGVFVYLKYFRNPVSDGPRVSESPAGKPNPTVGGLASPVPTTVVPTTTETQPAGTAGNDNAAGYFAAGRKHQEQGRMLAGSGSASEAEEEYRKAITEYNEAIKLLPVYPQAHENLGVALYDSGRLEDAVDEYKIAIDQYIAQNNAPTAQVLVNYGLALFNSKRYREAADAFGRAVETDPGDHDLYALRGFALQNAGDYEAAKADYHRYLALQPSGQYASAVKQILAARAQPPTQTGNR